MYKIKLLDKCEDYPSNTILDIHTEQIVVGRNPNCYIRYSPTDPGVSRTHALLTFRNDRVRVTKPYNFKNDIIVNGVVLEHNYTDLDLNSELQFSKNGPRIIIPFKKISSSPDYLILFSFVLLFISLSAFIYVLIRYS